MPIKLPEFIIDNKRYCSKCGELMPIVKQEIVGYERTTGIAIKHSIWKCPKYKWYNFHDSYRT